MQFRLFGLAILGFAITIIASVGPARANAPEDAEFQTTAPIA